MAGAQPVLVGNAGLREVNARDGAIRILKGNHACLHCSASGDEYVESGLGSALWPKQGRMHARIVKIVVLRSKPSRNVIGCARIGVARVLVRDGVMQ
jgi:hypothetical protein